MSKTSRVRPVTGAFSRLLATKPVSIPPMVKLAIQRLLLVDLEELELLRLTVGALLAAAAGPGIVVAYAALLLAWIKAAAALQWTKG